MTNGLVRLHVNTTLSTFTVDCTPTEATALILEWVRALSASGVLTFKRDGQIVLAIRADVIRVMVVDSN